MSDFKAKMHQILFPLGLCPRPRWGAYSALPAPLDVFKGPTSKGREEKGERKERGGKGKGRVWRRREGRVGPPPPNWGVWIRQYSMAGSRSCAEDLSDEGTLLVLLWL